MADADSWVAPPEVLILCPECQAELNPAAFEFHLRRLHHLYLFRGAPGSKDAILPVLLDALLTPQPALDAWIVLADLAREEHGPRAADFLTAALTRSLARLPGEERSAILSAVGQLLAASGAAALLEALAADDDLSARRLALSALAHLRAPPIDAHLHVLRRLLVDRRLPSQDQVRALAGVMRSSRDEVLIEELLDKLVRGVGKARGIDRLRDLEELAGPSPLIDRLCANLEENLRMTCPRCSIELRRPLMVEHLWEEHRLVLDGRRVREGWAVVEDWVDACRAQPDPELLSRCRIVAERIDPETGPLRLQRLLLARGLGDAQTRRAVLEDARQQHAARCPWCYALVPVPRDAPPLELVARPGRLSAKGYSVEVRERGLKTWLEVTTPTRLIYRGQEPLRQWTPRGALVVLVGPLVLLALVLALAMPEALGGPLFPVVVVLGAALIVYVLVRAAWRYEAPLDERVRDYAWSLLAPELDQGGFVPLDAAFLAGLAQVSSGARLSVARAELLRELLRRTESALLAGQCPPAHLAALRRLQIEDEAAVGADPVPLVARLLTRCFEGKLPVAFAQSLLEEWECPWWKKGNLARLRVLLCDRAFEAGFEVRNLLDAGQTAPALGAVLNTENERGLAALRLLWSLRPTRPWDRCGKVRTAFELAEAPEEVTLFRDHPDLLLYQEERSWRVAGDGGTSRMGPAEILLTEEGVWLQEVRFTSPPRTVEVRAKSLSLELYLGGEVFRSSDDLNALADRMDRWFRYAFYDFLPEVARAATWQSPDRATILRSWGAVPCPECQRYSLARVGQVGIALDEVAG